MRIVGIIQARMASTRLPGKVLLDAGGVTVLSRVVRRLRRATRIQEVVVATTESARDNQIVVVCNGLNVHLFRGSEHDVLDRYHRAAQKFRADAVVRITADCPLVDGELVDEVIHLFAEQHADYASNVFPRTYPRGLDVEVFSSAALGRAWEEARGPHEREHVTPYFYEHPESFRMASVAGREDYSHYRWTLDTFEDLELIRAIYARFDNRDDFQWREVLALIEREPELAEMNSHVLQKAVHAH